MHTTQGPGGHCPPYCLSTLDKLAGSDGVVQKVILAEKDTACPAKGELEMIPCFVGTNGKLREARDLGAEF